MCLAVPGKVVEWVERDTLFARARVEFAGVRREVSMQCVPEAAEGDYVLVHAGIAISRVDEAEAQAILDALDALQLLDEEPSSDEALTDDMERKSPDFRIPETRRNAGEFRYGKTDSPERGT
ncbi:MAG: HypC/HybG/HupF family hydrogenase formation chaperone [Pirellulaceae bacterium]